MGAALMPSYMCVRKRVYWVREVMHIEAENEEAAEKQFYSEFYPELIIESVYRTGNDTVYTPLEIIKNESPISPRLE